MHEGHFFAASVVGLVLLAIGWVWVTVLAWRHRVAWGVAVLLFPPAGLLFAARHFAAARLPLAIGLVGLLATAGPPIVNRLLPVDLGPRDALVDGERHVTLTGWDRTDYGVLRSLTDVVVLQMANADVTDDTLRLLDGFDRLRELDLNGTQVTDAGLAVLAGLPTLERLRLASTPITDAGFRQHLAPVARLVELDLRGTQVAKDTVAAWRSAQRGRRALR
jgi:hypothetical protein